MMRQYDETPSHHRHDGVMMMVGRGVYIPLVYTPDPIITITTGQQGLTIT